MVRQPPSSTLFPTRRSSDLPRHERGRAHSPGRGGPHGLPRRRGRERPCGDRKSTRLNSSHPSISYAVFCLKKKKKFNVPDTKTQYKRRIQTPDTNDKYKQRL